MADITAPNLTQEDLQAIQQAQAQAGDGAGVANGQEIPPASVNTAQMTTGVQGQYTQPQQPMQPAPTGQNPDEIELAKKLLGLDELQRQAQEAQEKLRQLEEERTKSVVMQKYPDVPMDLVEKEIEKVAQINPQLAENMKLNPDLMEMAVKAVLASVKPQQQPDNITQGDSAGDTSPDDELVEKVRKGEVDEIGLGEYILKTATE